VFAVRNRGGQRQRRLGRRSNLELDYCPVRCPLSYNGLSRYG
jgi:hypothetical protein